MKLISLENTKQSFMSTMEIIHTVAENGKKFQLNKLLSSVKVLITATGNNGGVDG